MLCESLNIEKKSYNQVDCDSLLQHALNASCTFWLLLLLQNFSLHLGGQVYGTTIV